MASLPGNCGGQLSNRSSSSNSKIQFMKANNPSLLLGVITESNGEGDNSFNGCGDYAPKILMNSARTSNT